MRSSMRTTGVVLLQAAALAAVGAATLAAQAPVPKPAPPAAAAASVPAPTDNVAVPPGYVIGTDDVLSIVFWREKDISSDAVVRPDGKISLPLVNEVQASGLTPEQLRQQVTEAAKKYLDDPTVSVVVKQINSRNVYITGMVGKAGKYPLSDHMTVVQLIAMAGGLQEFADKKHISIIHVERRPDGVPWSHSFNYEDFMNRRNLGANIELKPGDTVIVP